MHFVAKRRRTRLTRREYLGQIVSRLFSILCLLTISLFLFTLLLLTSTHHPPPPALPHASGGSARRQDDVVRCGCRDAFTCTSAVDVGAFERPPLPSNDTEMGRRQMLVREVAKQAWGVYERVAWGKDELKPVSEAGVDSFGGLGVSVVEALGTLYIMRLEEEYERAREWVEGMEFRNVEGIVNVHEVTTRVLGGLLSVYQLTGDDLYLQKAEHVAEGVKGAFESLNGVPYPRCNWGGECEGLVTTQSAAAGLSLEFRALGMHSLKVGVRNLRCRAERAVQAVVEAGPRLLREEITMELVRKRSGGNESEQTVRMQMEEWRVASMDSYYAYMVQLWQEAVSVVGGGPSVDTRATFSKDARGFYEYLTKAWRQGGGCESSLRFPLDASMHVLLKRAIVEPKPGELALRSLQGNETEGVVEQAMCYLPAVFHVAAQRGGVDERRAEQWRDVAEGITEACVKMYKRFEGGLGGDAAEFKRGVWVTTGAYRLQADLVEALFTMWRMSKEERYRDEAWNVFYRMLKQCRLENGAFTVLEEKKVGQVEKGDHMPSEFVGALLKYFYLLFSDDDVLDLDSWVFNRMGHPLLVMPGIGAVDPCQTEWGA